MGTGTCTRDNLELMVIMFVDKTRDNSRLKGLKWNKVEQSTESIVSMMKYPFSQVTCSRSTKALPPCDALVKPFLLVHD